MPLAFDIFHHFSICFIIFLFRRFACISRIFMCRWCYAQQCALALARAIAALLVGWGGAPVGWAGLTSLSPGCFFPWCLLLLTFLVFDFCYFDILLHIFLCRMNMMWGRDDVKRRCSGDDMGCNTVRWRWYKCEVDKLVQIFVPKWSSIVWFFQCNSCTHCGTGKLN